MLAKNDVTEPYSVRTFMERDAAVVERLSHEGLLPSQEGCDFQHPCRAAESYLVSAREHFWVAEVEAEVIGTVALAEASPDVGALHWLRVAPAWQADDLVARRLVEIATAHARAMGFLKLIVEAPTTVEPQAVSYFGMLGFQFSRSREVDGRNRFEFYLNLYQRPRLLAE
jgi:N-acetylglutamate synthase-like GNAT family acetyltransferase